MGETLCSKSFQKTMNTENTKETEVAPCGAGAFKKISDDGQKICSRKLKFINAKTQSRRGFI